MSLSAIKWGVLGAAEIAREFTIPAIRDTEGSVPYALASRRGVPHELIRQFGFATGYDNYDALLTDPQVDVVYLPLPNALHAQWAVKAAQAGKHVLCEKPAALNAAQTVDIVNACQQAGVLFMEAMMYQFHAQHARTRELIDAGAIGEVRGMQVKLTFNLTKSQSDFRHNTLAQGGGSLYDLGCYCIHAIRSLLGVPDRVATMPRFAGLNSAEMAATTVFGYDSGLRAGFDCGMDASLRHDYEVYGTQGALRVHKAFAPQPDGAGCIEQVADNGVVTATEPVTSFQYPNGVAHFADCARHNRTPDYAPADVLANMRVLDACIESATSGRIVELEK